MRSDETAAPVEGASAPEPRRRVPRLLTVTTIVLAAAAALVFAWGGAHPTGNTLAALAGLVIAVVSGLAWLWVVILAAVRRRFAWSIVVAPLLLAASVVAVASGAAERFAFELAKPVLAGAVADGSCPAFAGVLPIGSCTRLGDTGSVFMVEGAGLLNQAGWVHFADDAEAAALAGEAEPGQEGWLAFEPRGEGWYRVIYVW